MTTALACYSWVLWPVLSFVRSLDLLGFFLDFSLVFMRFGELPFNLRWLPQETETSLTPRLQCSTHLTIQLFPFILFSLESSTTKLPVIRLSRDQRDGSNCERRPFRPILVYGRPRWKAKKSTQRNDRWCWCKDRGRCCTSKGQSGRGCRSCKESQVIEWPHDYHRQSPCYIARYSRCRSPSSTYSSSRLISAICTSKVFETIYWSANQWPLSTEAYKVGVSIR